MKKTFSLRIILSLRFLIVSLSIAGILLTVGNGYYAIYQFQKNLLINMSLESNRIYAEKLAIMTDIFLKNATSQLAISANLVASIAPLGVSDVEGLQAELDLVKKMSESFNSVSFMNREGHILAISPKSTGLRGYHLRDSLADQFVEPRAAFIGPVIGPTGTYLSFFSHPVVNKSGQYIGNLIGTMYLHDNVFLEHLLSRHGYLDGSYIYVVSSDKELIYHPEKNRMGENVTSNDVINDVVEGQSGAHEVVNSKGIEMVAGYAYVKESGWGIVVQTPRASVLKELDKQIWLISKQALPVQVFILLCVITCAYLIAKPLRLLAQNTKNHDPFTKVSAWFYEAYLLEGAIRKEIDSLNEKVLRFDDDRKTDPLTGLMNRRAMDEMVKRLTASSTPFYVIFFDIDHFKQVNDEFGHEVGDLVLKSLAELVRQKIASHGSLIRSGGEEFVIILPSKSSSFATAFAEEVRELVSRFVITQISRPITISLGVSNWVQTVDCSDTFRQADIAMYESKNTGRNRVTSHIHIL
ncbi:sensor domain-containing diguanylate cyclase [Marinomonas sp. IMCC 4694]|uniref:sensor domain-containing diguanylate cyclase n=1 Tax=Marinomonas sp. IMCC 4694 TaxID=2605432 RepID=UPI0011E89C7F|nr:sensor domain-containing diguanylate cyclase [Marinomonas sp. IMCC 4694]TYL48411.1 diguanylate cyclase [Marinomonas sp. IMCC 4694]